MPPVIGRPRVRGFAETRRNIAHMIRENSREVARAAKFEFEIEKRESQKRTPIESGALRKSHRVLDPEIRGGIIHVELVVGADWILNDKGVATEEYALTVHEDLEAFHDEGQAKFLESTLNESRPYMAGRIARRYDLRRAAKAT